METSLKTGFAQIFSCCPKNLSCLNFGGAAAPLAPPARKPMETGAKEHLFPWIRTGFQTITTRPIPLLCPVYLEKSCPKQKGIYEIHRFELQKQDFANGLGTCILYLRSYEA